MVETTQPLRWIVKPGARDMFHTTALGRAIVAHLPGEQQGRLVTKACATLPSRGRAAARAKLEAELAATRVAGTRSKKRRRSQGWPASRRLSPAWGSRWPRSASQCPSTDFRPRTAPR